MARLLTNMVVNVTEFSHIHYPHNGRVHYNKD